jgi:hypothetical protein
MPTCLPHAPWLSRRCFLRAAASALPLTLFPNTRTLFAAEAGRELRADLVIVGGGVGGCAAALAACESGLNVILSEETDWIGGQLTAQAVPPDEHPWIESFGCTRSYRDYRDRVREFYRLRYPLTPEARAQRHFNPGNGWVSRLCHEPRVSLAVLCEMLAPHLSGGRLRVFTDHKPVAAETDGDHVRAVTLQDLRRNERRVLTAPHFIDATELGDLLPLTGTEFVSGAESQKDTGEPHASTEAQPGDQQAFTCCYAMDHLEGEDHTIAKPAEYGFWRDYVPAMAPPWPGPLLSWRTTHPITLEPREMAFDPTMRVTAPNLWSYRRILDAAQFASGAVRSGISLVNWPQNDYWLGPLIGVSEADAARHIARAKQLSLSLLYWMQTEAPRPDGGTGWKGLRLRADIVGTTDGLAKYPYIREARRLRAEFTVTERHVGTDARMQATGKSRDDITAATFPDSVGVGAYRIDLHPSTGGRNYVDLSSLPFQIPLGALIPRRVENLLAAAKNVGTTHLTNGCYRLHPVEWNLGEAAGALVAFCQAQKAVPRQVRNDTRLLAEFQQCLRARGIELEWPRVRPL